MDEIKDSNFDNKISTSSFERKVNKYDPIKGYFGFEKSKLFTLDFVEDKISFGEVKTRADQYNIPILFANITVLEDIKGLPHRGFEVVFLNDVMITDKKVTKIMYRALKVIFPESYRINDDSSGVYLDEPLLKYLDKSIPEITIESLIRNMSLYLKDKHGATHFKKYLVDFSNSTGTALTPDNFLDISVSNDLNTDNGTFNGTFGNISPNSIIIESNIGENLPNLYYIINLKDGSMSPSDTSRLNAKSKNHLPNRSSILEDIDSSCKLFQEFESNSRKLSNDELFGLATNLNKVESGLKRFYNTLHINSYFNDENKKYSDWLLYLKIMKHYPSKYCNGFCPYKNECYHANDILSTAKPEQHTTVKLANYKTTICNREEALTDFKQKLKLALEADDTKIHAINAPIAIGKSTSILELMENTNLKILFAFPTNDLKNELYTKAIDRGIKAVRSPSLLESKDKLPSGVWNHIESLHQIGKHHAVFNYVKEVIDKGEVDKCCSDILKEYQKDLTQFYSSNSHAFTTHSRLITLDYWVLKKYDAVIIDEDIILNCMIPNQIEIPISKLEATMDDIDSKCKLAKKIRAAVDAAQREPWFTLPSIEYDNTYDNISTSVNVSSFCQAKMFYSKKKVDENILLESNYHENSIVFFKPFRLEHRIKYIMLSATIDQKICNYCFGESRVKFYECKKAKYVGTLNQYTKRTMSRSDIDKNPGILEELIKSSGFDDVITFKKYSKGKYHFGKTTGVDTLKGKNLTILGTPHQPEWLYKLFAYTLGWESFDENKDAIIHYQPVIHKEFKFWFMTFDETVNMLRNIQFWMIESELEQAVGRARLLTEDCIVNVFSNFPLSQANLVEFEYIVKELR